MTIGESVTGVSLLARLRQVDRDEDGWREFVERYGWRIHGWCLQRGLQAADADDVTQNVLVKLADHLRHFDYDPSRSFRGWLRRVTENSVKDYVKGRHRRNTARGGSGIFQRLIQAEAARESAARLNDAFDLELLDQAASRVRARVATNRWMAWHLTAREGRSGTEVAAELGMKVASVYTARSQVQQMIREEVGNLEA